MPPNKSPVLKELNPILALKDPPSAVDILRVAIEESKVNADTPATLTSLILSTNPYAFTRMVGTELEPP